MTQEMNCDIPTGSTEVKKIIRKYYEQLHASKLNNLGEMEKFLENHKLPKISQKETDSLICSIYLKKWNF